MRKILVAAVAMAGLAACATLEEDHGYVPPPEDLRDVVVGRDTRDTVRVLLGQPGSTGLIDESTWYYATSDYERFLWRAPVEVDRQVVAISYDDVGVVTNIERFGIEDGQVVALSRRVTDGGVQGISFLQQLFGNLGNIDPGALLGDG